VEVQNVKEKKGSGSRNLAVLQVFSTKARQARDPTASRRSRLVALR